MLPKIESVPPSPYDEQIPSTSSSTLYQNSPDALMYGEPWQPMVSPFGSLPPPPTTPTRSYPGSPGPMVMGTPEPATGGRAMRQLIAARNTADWADGYGQYRSPVRTPGLSRTPSMLSTASGMSQMSGMSLISNTSGLTIRTDYSATELEMSYLMNQANFKENTAPRAPPTSTIPRETVAEKQAKLHIGGAIPTEVFKWVAASREHRDYRKMAIRIYYDSVHEEDHAVPKRKRLAVLAASYPTEMAKVLDAVMEDVRMGAGKIRHDALISLRECLEVAKPNVVEYLNARTERRPDMRQMEIAQLQHHRLNVLFSCINARRGEDEPGTQQRSDLDSDCAITAVKVLYSLLSDVEIRKRCRGQKEWAKRVMDMILNDRDIEHKRRFTCVDLLRRFVGKDVFCALDGVRNYLDFLDKSKDGSAAFIDAPPPKYYFHRVEKHEEMVAVVVKQLLSLVGTPRQKTMCREKIVELDGIQILTSWLDHGSPRVLHDITRCLYETSQAQAVVGKDLQESIRRILQLCGNNDPNFVEFLILSLHNLIHADERHKLSMIASSGARELLRLAGKWAEAIAVEGEANPKPFTLLALVTQTLYKLIERGNGAEGEDGGRAAMEELLADASLMPTFVRLLSFDFVYSEPWTRSGPLLPTDLSSSILTMNRGGGRAPTANHINPVERSSQHQRRFTQLKPERRAFELMIKEKAARILLRLLRHQITQLRSGEKIENLLPLASTTDALWGEPVTTMLLRRMYEMYLISNQTNTKEYNIMRNLHAINGASRYPEALASNKEYTALMEEHKYVLLLSEALSLLLVDCSEIPECLALITDYIGVRGIFNPIIMLIPETHQLGSSMAQFAKTVLVFVDGFITVYQADSKGFENPMRAWIMDERAKYFFNMVIQTVSQMPRFENGMLHRLWDRFNHCLGHTPAPTPAYPVHTMQSL